MRRVEVRYDGDEMVISPEAMAHVIDACINLALTGVLCLVIVAIITIFEEASYDSIQQGTHISPSLHLILVILLCTPMLIFIGLTLNSLKNAFFGSKTIIERLTKVWKSGKSNFAKTDTITRLEIKYTGLRSPSRYTLIAQTEDGRTQRLLSTGYTGSREELVALSQLIGDFTGRPDLCVR
jgi:hypothetical protein